MDMCKKALAGIILALFLASFLMSGSDIFSTVRFAALAATDTCLVFRQDFNNETVGQIPKDWALINPQFGSFITVGTVYYGASGRSAQLIDNSTLGAPDPYRYFPEQRGTIVVSFAVRLTNKTKLRVSIDNGIGNGSNIIFWEDGQIGYRNCKGNFVPLRQSYFLNRWYKIKMIMSIPHNVYNIHIDDHLEAINANFTGSCNQVHRIIIETNDGMLATGYIDNVEVRKCIMVPEDFPTIQEGINAASPGDTVFVAKNRVYFENVKIAKSIWLVGEDKSTTIIDGHYIKTPDRSSNGILVQYSNVTIYGFTVKNSEANGIFIKSQNVIIHDNNITNSLGCGIRIYDSKNTIYNNIILSNLRGIQISYGRGNIIRTNIIRSNDEAGLICDVGTENNVIYQNRFVCNPTQAHDYGVNKWDDGYPYLPNEEKGGGNYWSDFNGTDIFSGVKQDEHGPCCSPLPDGVCDTPYIIKPKSQDNYPLFLIQNVTQDPDPANVTYATGVTVTATLLKNVDVQTNNAWIYAYVNFSELEQYPMLRVGISDNWRGIIPAKNYCTKVVYNVSIRAFCATWLNSTNYPIDYPLPERYYHVGDKRAPNIETVTYIKPLNENETIKVTAKVTDWDPKASGVDKVFLNYFCRESNRWWKTQMTKTTGDNYEAVMPKQPPGSLKFSVEAIDKAGNSAIKNNTETVNELAELVLERKIDTTYEKCEDPCNIDFKIMSKEQTLTNKDYRISNAGQKDLDWTIIELKPNAWFDIQPTKGKITPGKSTDLTITVNTKGAPETGIYVGEFSIKANGSKPEWTIIMRVTVRHILVDDSWASCEDPARCDVNSVQNYAFRTSWDHNCTNAYPGRIKISIIGWVNVNKTGWATFNYTLKDPGSKTFSVEAVEFPFVYENKVYTITSFTQKAPSRTTIWDRVKIVLKINDTRIDVCTNANVSWNDSIYEYDKLPFNGTVHFRQCFVQYEDPVCMLNDSLHHDTPGNWTITVASIKDYKYNLTAFQSNTVWCVWDRIKIIAGGVLSQQVPTGEKGTVWFIAIYDYDNQVFKGNSSDLRASKLYVNGSEMEWVPERERWEKSYIFYDPGTREFKITNAYDRKYNLTKIEDSVGLVNITWVPLWPTISLAPVIVTAAAGLVSAVAFLALWIIGKENSTKIKQKRL